MLTLIVPGLIWTRQALADLTYDLPLPALSTLLGKGRLCHRPPRATAAVLAEITGLPAPLPAAALRRLALREQTNDSDWLCLDPVRLRLAERALIVDDPRQLHLTDEESVALVASLTPAFAELGDLVLLAPDTWNLRLRAAAPAFQDLAEATGRAASPLPLESAYAPWRHALNEAQMILHTHPVNQAREAAGQAVVNSLWPWGGGRLPMAGSSPHDVLWSSDPVAQGIARLLRIECRALPSGFSSTTARAPLAIIATLEHPARSGDATVWREELARFETDWLAPALGALRSGRLDVLHLLGPGDLASVELYVHRHDSWKFWRTPRTLADALAKPEPT